MADTGDVSATGYRRRQVLCLPGSVPLTFPREGISWETRPRLVHGMISRAGVAVRVSALSTRCCGAAGKRPRGTWSWSSTRWPPNSRSGRR